MEGLRSVCERNAIEMPNIKWWRRKKRKWEWVGGKLWPPNMFASTQEIEFYTAEKYLLLPPRKSMFDILGNRRQCLPCQHWRRWTSIGGYTGVDQTSRGTAPKFKSIQNSDWTLDLIVELVVVTSPSAPNWAELDTSLVFLVSSNERNKCHFLWFSFFCFTCWLS